MYCSTYDTENYTAPPLSSCNSNSSRHGSGRNSMESSPHSRAGPPPREYRKTSREERQRETIGVMRVPGRILATLQRKFWDSNQARLPTHSPRDHQQTACRAGGGGAYNVPGTGTSIPCEPGRSLDRVARAGMMAKVRVGRRG